MFTIRNFQVYCAWSESGFGHEHFAVYNCGKHLHLLMNDVVPGTLIDKRLQPFHYSAIRITRFGINVLHRGHSQGRRGGNAAIEISDWAHRWDVIIPPGHITYIFRNSSEYLGKVSVYTFKLWLGRHHLSW